MTPGGTMARTRGSDDPEPISGPRADPARAAGVRRGGGVIRGPLGDLSVEDVRHPTEPSRFALALVAMSVPIAVALGAMVLLDVAAIIVFVVVALLLIRLSVQLWRIRLLGDAVLVSAQTLPAVQEVLDAVRERLGYTRPIDLFVVDKVSRVLSGDPAPVSLTSFFGVHVLVAEGDALGDPADPKERQQLLFTLATYVGALRARSAQWWSPLFTAFQMTGLWRFVWPFVLPYHRATVYSGDRIAYACCGDLDVSLQAVYRALVGRDVAEQLRAEGFTGQALVVRRRLLLRFAQLLRATPHVTNRYLHLLAFVQQLTPVAYTAHRPSLTGGVAEVEPVLAELGRKRAFPGVVSVGVALAGAVLAGGLILGLFARAPALTPKAEELVAFLPEDMRSGCATVDSGVTVRPVVSIECAPTGDRPERIQLHLYETPDEMRAAVDEFAAEHFPYDCASGFEGRTERMADDVNQGPLLCYSPGSEHPTLVWGSTEHAVVAVAQDSRWSLPAMVEWFDDEGSFIQ